MRRPAEVFALILIVAAALLARLWSLSAGVPHAVGIDEPQVVDRAIRILNTGDWNPHVFDYPALVIYLHAVVAILRFLWGALGGEWGSLDAFAIAAAYGWARGVSALIGAATAILTYRLAREIAPRGVALLAAAQIAVQPLHVRESHFALTDVPMTALTTLALALALRASRVRTIRAYGWAGAACGLAAGAKYTGGVVLAAAIAAWAIHEWTSRDRGWKLAAVVGGAAAAFLIAAPYTLLDLPAFLDGFAAQFARFAVPPPPGADPAWWVYLKHLSPTWARWSVPLALAGAGMLLYRRPTRLRSVPVIAFAGLFFYLLSSHSIMFGRYALPLLPVMAVLSSVAVVEAFAWLRSLRPFAAPTWGPLLGGAFGALLFWAPIEETVKWLDQQKRADTREIAADWLKANAPKGVRLVVENSGPTYLYTTGFRVVGTEVMVDHPIDWYRARADYLVISGANLDRYGDYVGAGPTVFQIAPTPQRWGPPILIVRLRP